MSGPDAVDPPAETPARPRSMAFRKRAKSRMAPEESRRQSALVESAWRHFRVREPMIAFLNTRHDALDALPLHLAIESDEGLERVQGLLEEMRLQA